MKYLILLNRKFPFKTGEPFLENEIDILSKNFDRVIICPSDVCFADEQTRKIPPTNVKTCIMENSSLITRKVIYSIESLRYFFKKTSEHGKKKLIDAYFRVAAKRQADKVLKVLNISDIKLNDEVYIYSYWFYINAKVACIVKQALTGEGIRCVAISRAHRFDIYEEKRKFGFLPQREQILSSLDCVFSCSDDGAHYLKRKYPQFASKVAVSYLGTFDHGYKDYESLNSEIVIVSCSRLTAIKRVDRIAKSLWILEKKHNLKRRIKWIHIGDGEKRKEIEDYCQNNIREINVEFKGYISNTEVYDLYKKMRVDLFVNVSSSEGIPVSIMEALSFGIPVIATDVGGTAEIVKDEYNGLTMNESFTDNELADKISYFINLDSDSLTLYRHNARELWEEKCNAETNYKGFSGLLVSLLNNEQRL